MNLRPITIVLASLVLGACGSSPPPEPATAQEPTTAALPPPPTSAPPAEPAKPAEPTAEEKKKAEALKALEADRAKWEAEHKAELSRWTQDLRNETKALVDKTFPTGKAAIQAAMAGKHRKPGHAARDKDRHPAETLDFFGFKPTMTVIEVGPGEGWYTELLAPALAKKGRLLATNGDPNGPPDERSTFYAQRFKGFVDTSPEAYGKIEVITIDGKAPKIGRPNLADMALLFRGLHGMVSNGKLDTWLAELHEALKPNGILAVEQHRAKPDAKPEESAKQGYLPEKWVIEKIESAGFKLEKKSEINANPKDTKDHPEGVWTLPPTLKLGEKDKDKYTAIGESDRMTLKFVKVEKKADKPVEKKPAEKPAEKK